MKQNETKEQSNQKNNSILYLGIVFILAAIISAVVIYFAYSEFCPGRKIVNIQKTLKSDTENIYFAKGHNGDYSLINIESEETQDFIPEGYKIVEQYAYQTFTNYLLLQKDSNLFLYNIENENIESLSEKYDYFKLAEDEDIRLYPSVTEMDRFYIVIYKYDMNDSMGMGLIDMLSTRSYYLDAQTQKANEAHEIDFSGCYQYDSKNERFFNWKCDEGIGVSIPLVIKDLQGNELQEAISLQEYGLNEEGIGLVSMQYNNGYFLAMEKGNLSKIIAIDPKSSELIKDEYIVSDEVKSEIDESYPYSMAIVSSKNTIVVGGGNFILLLRFDENKRIIESKFIEDKEIYANYIFPYKGKVYYQAKDALRIINLDTWEIEKSISSEKEEDITLIKLDK